MVNDSVYAKRKKSQADSVKPYLDHRKIARDFLEYNCDIIDPVEDRPGFVVYDTFEIQINEADLSLILTIMATLGGVVENLRELQRSAACKRAVVLLRGVNSGHQYIRRLSCCKWWCPECGSYMRGRRLIKGEIQKERIKSVYARLNAGYEVHDKEMLESLLKTLSKVTVLQYVFTVPESERFRYMSKEGLNQLFCSAKKILTSTYANAGMISTMHVVGDNSSKFHPHVNVLVFLQGDVRVMPREGTQDMMLEKIKMRWARALMGHGSQIDLKAKGFGVNVYKNFAKMHDVKRKLHMIKYITKPIDQKYMEKWINEEDHRMIAFTVRKLKGFRYVRYWGMLSNNRFEEWYSRINEGEGEKMKGRYRTEFENGAGEPLRVLGIFMMSFDDILKNPAFTVTKVGRDFYRVEKNQIKGGNKDGCKN